MNKLPAINRPTYISSEQQYMKQLQKQPKLKNLISFGKQNINDLSFPTEKNSVDRLSVRGQDSYSFQFSKQINHLGIDVLNTSQRRLSQSIDLNLIEGLPSEKIRLIIQSLRQNLIKVRDEMTKIKKDQNTFLEYMRRQNIIMLNKLANKNQCEQSKFNKQPNSSKKSNKFNSTGVKLKICRQYKIDIKPQNKFKTPSQKSTQIQKQIQWLKYQNNLKSNQIQLLKQQLSVMNSLNKKRQIYYNQRLRVKQLQWQRKINQIIQQINLQNRCYTQNISDQYLEVEGKNQSGRSNRSSKNKYNKTQISEDQTHQSLALNLKNSIESKYIDDTSNIHISHYKSRTTSRSKQQNNSNHKKFNISQLKIDKLRFVRETERKKSTQSSYERVNNKIKKFQQTVKNQIKKICT